MFLLLVLGFGVLVVVVAAAVSFVLSFVFIFGFGLVWFWGLPTQYKLEPFGKTYLISIISPVGKSMGHFHD